MNENGITVSIPTDKWADKRASLSKNSDLRCITLAFGLDICFICVAIWLAVFLSGLGLTCYSSYVMNMTIAWIVLLLLKGMAFFQSRKEMFFRDEDGVYEALARTIIV